MVRRGGMMVALGAYLLVLAGSPIGHGWALLVHVASTPHAAPEWDAAFAAVDLAHNSAEVIATARAVPTEQNASKDEMHAEAHRHGHSHSHGHHHGHSHAQHADTEAAEATPEPATLPKAEAAPSAAREHAADPSAPHTHGGRLHTHAPPPDTAPALRVLLLDRHCLFVQPSVPHPYPSACADPVRIAEGIAEFVGFVETPPPRSRA